jgi:hypothetical protein
VSEGKKRGGKSNERERQKKVKRGDRRETQEYQVLTVPSCAWLKVVDGSSQWVRVALLVCGHTTTPLQNKLV